MRARILPCATLMALACLLAPGCEIFLPGWWGEDGEPCDEDAQCKSGLECTGPVDPVNGHRSCRPEGFGWEDYEWDGATGYDPCAEHSVAATCVFFSGEPPCRCTTGCDGHSLCQDLWDEAVCIYNVNGDLHCGLTSWTGGIGVFCEDDGDCPAEAGQCVEFPLGGAPFKACTVACTDSCGPGYLCEAVAGEGTKVCGNEAWFDLPALTAGTCTTDADCTSTFLPSCIEFRDGDYTTNRHCTAACGSNYRCPPGSRCTYSPGEIPSQAGPYCALDTWTNGYGAVCDEHGILPECDTLRTEQVCMQAEIATIRVSVCVRPCPLDNCPNASLSCVNTGTTANDYCAWTGW